MKNYNCHNSKKNYRLITYSILNYYIAIFFVISITLFNSCVDEYSHLDTNEEKLGSDRKEGSLLVEKKANWISKKNEFFLSTKVLHCKSSKKNVILEFVLISSHWSLFEIDIQTGQRIRIDKFKLQSGDLFESIDCFHDENFIYVFQNHTLTKLDINDYSLLSNLNLKIFGITKYLNNIEGNVYFQSNSLVNDKIIGKVAIFNLTKFEITEYITPNYSNLNNPPKDSLIGRCVSILSSNSDHSKICIVYSESIDERNINYLFSLFDIINQVWIYDHVSIGIGNKLIEENMNSYINEDYLIIDNKKLVQCFNLSSGLLKWEKNFQNSYKVYNNKDKLFVMPNNDGLEIYSIESGEILKKYNYVENFSSIIEHKGIIYFVDNFLKRLWAIDINSDKHLWLIRSASSHFFDKILFINTTDDNSQSSIIINSTTEFSSYNTIN